MWFNHIRYSQETTLSSYVWHLKKTLDVTPNLKCSIVTWATHYSKISKKCLSCLYEKLLIITYPRQHKLLNKRSELFCKCRYENKHLLKTFRFVIKYSHWRRNFNCFIENLLVRPSHKKNYLRDNWVSMILRVVNN